MSILKVFTETLIGKTIAMCALLISSGAFAENVGEQPTTQALNNPLSLDTGKYQLTQAPFPNIDVGKAYTGRIVSFKSGDTFDVRVENREEDVQTIKLYGIEAPALSQPHGEETLARLRDLSMKKEITVHPIGINKVGALSALVFIGGDCLNELSLDAGHVWLREDCKNIERWCKLQRQAKAAERGLWHQDDPIPPWEWDKSVDTLFDAALM